MDFVGNKLGHKKIDYGDGGFFYRLFLAPKMELCYTKDNYGLLNETKTFKGYHDSWRLHETWEDFKLKNGATVIGEFPLPW